LRFFRVGKIVTTDRRTRRSARSTGLPENEVTMDRDELLEREHASWSAFEAAVGRVPADRRADDGVVPGWSVKDLVWHCAYWAGFCADTIEARAAGDPSDPWDHDDVYWDAENDRVAQESEAMTWETVESRAAGMRERARAALAKAIDDVSVKWFVEETFEHYDEHAVEISRFADSPP
jgi:Mycothiol maleylpyruvate isomerase N-terminal domain